MYVTKIKPSDPQNPGESINFPFSSSESIFVKFEDKDICLTSGKLYVQEKVGKNWTEWKTSISSKIRYIKSKFGVLFIITESGELLTRGRTDSGQCGVVQEQVLEEFRILRFGRKSKDPCPHGLKYDDEGEIIISDVDCTCDSVYFVDTEGRIWTYGKKTIDVDSDGKIQVTQVKLPSKAFRIYCGRNHCVAFCEVQQVSDGSVSIFDENSQTLVLPDSSVLSDPSPSTPRRNSTNPKCDQCLSEASCRLSLLMKIADESAADSVDSTSEEITVDETPKNSKFKSKLNKFKFNFRTYSSKSRPGKNVSKSTWYSTSLPLGSFGSPNSTKKEDEGVEMSTISTISKQPPPAITDLTGSSSFSYVNLENFVGMDESSLSTTPESNSKRPSISTNSGPSSAAQSPAKSKLNSESSSSSIPLFGELWSWGDNQQGQLGHADTISRRYPKKIFQISGPFLKITVGNDHNVVLMATGEAYVWGSNSKGQLKQINQGFLESPTLWKLGSESTILDVEAESEVTVSIVAGQSRKENAVPLVHVFGNQNSENSGNSTVILSGAEKSGFPSKIIMISDEIWLKILKEKSENRIYSILQKATKLTKFSWQLHTVSEKLIHSSQNSEILKLLNNLNQKISIWTDIQSQLSAHFLRAFCKFPSEIKKFEKFKDLCRGILEFHFAYVEAVGFRCFNDLQIDSDIVSQVDKLCMDYNIDSNLQQRKLRYLFRHAFDLFQDLKPVLDSTMISNLPQNFWKLLSRTLERNEGYAKQTYAAHKQLLQFGIDTSLVKPGRLIIWTSHESADSTSQIKIKDASTVSSYAASATSPWRRLMGNSFTVIVVFSDSFGLIQNSGQILLESPLVWMNSFFGKPLDSEEQEPTLTDSEKELTVQVLAPEYEFHIEFPAVEMKNDFLNAFSASFRLHKEKTELTVLDDSVGPSVHVLPKTRYGSYEYSSCHQLYRNCYYEGFWKNGVPHGQGVMRYPDGGEYRGRFDRGHIEGFGEMKVPDIPKTPSPLMSSMFFVESSPKKIEKYHFYKGKWKNGKLHGLSQIIYSNGDTYEGYCIADVPEGHGVYRSNEGIGCQEVYVGAWSKGVKHGYGVLSLNKERYLGMWKDDQRHDRGCQITIDGVFHEGIFDKHRFTKGRVVYQHNESESPASFEGEFENIGIVSGKGILKLTPNDQIEGTIHGQIPNGELKITYATYTRKNKSPPDDSTKVFQFFYECPVASQWSVPPDLKWKEIFDHFLHDELGFSSDDEITDDQVKKAWEKLSTIIEKLKNLKNVQIDDKLERVPDVLAPWSVNYYATVTEYWRLCLETPHHPIYRLINGLVEIFCCSYNNIGTHSIMYDSAVLEFISLIERTYGVFRHIFPNLPPVEEMYKNIPENTKITVFEKNRNSKVDSTMLIENSEFTVFNPCCDFVIHHLFGQCYSELFTMYTVKCQEMDKKYWERVVFLNTATDARLLTYLGVETNLWPTDENISDLDKFMVRVTARKKFYETAIHTLQKLIGEFNPSRKLAILAETFSEISTCVRQFSSAGKSHTLNADELLPTCMYVVVRAQIQHLGAEIRLIKDFIPEVSESGELGHMFTTLCASYVKIHTEKSVP